MTWVSFQGERGAYSESAALAFFNEKIEVVPLPTFMEVVEYTENNKTDYSILPIENSLEGSVGENYDLLYSTKLNVVGEIYHRIKHCLIGAGSLEKIDTVYSHPQALGQCRKFIQEHDMKTVPTYDTAGSVKIIKDLNKENIGCIASKIAAELNNMPIVEEGIEDSSNNFTRFFVLSKNKANETNNSKTSIIFSIKHESGALFHVLKKFNEYKVNLTKIESRPNKNTPWEYNFYLDFEGSQNDSKISDMLKSIKDISSFLKILGSYPSAKLN